MKLTTKYFKLSNNIFELGLKPNEFVVLAYIARCSNNNSKAFPSYNKIAEKCNIGLSTAKRVVSNLVKNGLLTREHRVSNNNSNDTNSYSITEKVINSEIIENEVIEDNQVTTDEQDIKETEEIIKNFYEGEIVKPEHTEKKDLKEKLAIFQSYLNKKMSSNLRNLIKTLNWDEIVKADMQINANKKENYCTEKYIFNAIYDNKKIPNLRLVKYS